MKFKEGVPKDHIITIALDDDLNMVYRDPAELSRYVRSKVAEQEGMFYIFIVGVGLDAPRSVQPDRWYFLCNPLDSDVT